MKKFKISNVFIYMILSSLCICCIIPFLVIISASLTGDSELRKFGYSIFPHIVRFDAYKYLFDDPKQILSSYYVTGFVTVVGTVLSMSVMSCMAYPLSRKDFKHRRFLSFFVYFTMLFNGGMVPTYIIVANYFNLKDTIWALILPILVNAWNIYLLRTFFGNISPSIIESAKIDGANEFIIFFKLAVPLTVTGIATVTMFQVLMFWNDWFQSMLYINTDEIVSLQYLLYKMLNRVEFIARNASASGGLLSEVSVQKESVRMATCVLVAGPMLCVFPFFQKYFVRGIAIGSVKE